MISLQNLKDVLQGVTDKIMAKVDDKQDTIPTYTLVEYEAIKDDIPTGALFNIKDDKTQITNAGTNKYSTDEIICGEWIDGKPIYRKVISITNPVVETDGTEVYNDISINLSVATLIKLDGKFYSNNAWYTYPYFIGTLATGNTKIRGAKLILTNNGTTLRVINSHTGYNNTSGYAVIEYTKTTD